MTTRAAGALAADLTVGVTGCAALAAGDAWTPLGGPAVGPAAGGVAAGAQAADSAQKSAAFAAPAGVPTPRSLWRRGPPARVAAFASPNRDALAPSACAAQHAGPRG